MQLVKEYIDFERGLDPKEAMSIGTYAHPEEKIKNEMRKKIDRIVKKYNIEDPKIKELQNDKEAIAIRLNINKRMRFIVRYDFKENFGSPCTLTHEVYNHPQNIVKGSWSFIMSSTADNINRLFDKLEERIDPKYWKGYLHPLKRIKKNIKYAI